MSELKNSIKGNIEITEAGERIKVKPIQRFQLEPLTTSPKLIQDFISLEGEGGTIGRSALYIRLDTCNCRCSFCDSSFSIEGKDDYSICDITENSFISYMQNKYPYKTRIKMNNLSITGGEPLLHLNDLSKIIDQILCLFPKIKNIIFETNGTLLSVKENCYNLIEQLSPFTNKISFMLSISPKLNGKVSFSNVKTDLEVLDIYRNVISNYNLLLDTVSKIQIKFVHAEELKETNEKLIEYVTDEHIFKKGFDTNSILIMPFTPDDPLGKRADVWNKSKDEAARYALDNNFRYSPRIHIDRRLD